MTVRINQFATIRRGVNNEEFPVPDGYIAGQHMTAAGTSNAMAAGTRFVEVAARQNIAINGYGPGTTAWVFANTVAYFPAAEGQTFTWSLLT